MTVGVLATCQMDQQIFHQTYRFYTVSVLASAEVACTSTGGTWTPADPPAATP